jgi:hypothetical protein
MGYQRYNMLLWPYFGMLLLQTHLRLAAAGRWLCRGSSLLTDHQLLTAEEAGIKRPAVRSPDNTKSHWTGIVAMAETRAPQHRHHSLRAPHRQERR